ncbi:hypothetical protein E3E31_01085 [Thermococcus sp. M39]|uniref:DUF257 family protein n=1 Tax=unclassified Thermococcus TaxID=2627626 RepID=UPI00143BAEAE|nr:MULTISPECIES: DUF257 family protein [unclassified Thermococcus]NJE07149.1 hypothetical protein [Thermococcus sp. M39]NJE12719.1 hypothetical protein [Thermococcus sp. LS2]
MTNGKSLVEYLGGIKLGESILIEYHPEDPVHILFKEALGYTKYYNYNPIILDVFDTLHLIKEQLRVMGWDVKKIEKLDVIKAGGIINNGNIVKRIDISNDPAVYTLDLIEFLKGYYTKNKPTVLIVLGMDKLLRLYTTEVATLDLHIAGAMKKFLGDESRIALYFANIELVSKEILYEWEELVTRVFEITLKEKKQFIIKVKKSIKIDEHGREFIVSAEELPLVKV